MTDPQSLIRLQAWLSPAFPTGAFSYSSGLEAAAAEGLVHDQKSLGEWLETLIETGPAWNDCVLLAASWRTAQADGDLAKTAELARAMSFSKTRDLETTAQGAAFLIAAKAWGDIPALPADCPLPVAVGAVAGTHNTDLDQTLAAFLHALISNQIQAALRLIKLGQQAGVELVAALEPKILAIAERAAYSTLEDLGSSAITADIMAARHETLNSRIFRS